MARQAGKVSIMMERSSMRRAIVSLFSLVLIGSSAALALQAPVVRVVSAGPTGELRELTEANEIRIVFSEPMVALGKIPSNPTPSWIRISPAIPGSFRWSGTTILLFTPSASTPVPRATRYTVSVDGAATAVSGRQLGAPYEFSFTTPTVRLLSARWARRDDRFDRPVHLALRFNQRVRPEDVVAHLTVRLQPHAWDAPVMSAAERARLEATTPGGTRLFDAKVAAARQVAARTDAVDVRVATVWDRERFPPEDTLVVLETVTSPSPAAWLQLTLGAGMPSPEGPERPPTPETTTVELPSMFFVTGPSCKSGCNPSGFNPIRFTEQVRAADFATALSVTDITDPARPESQRAPGAVRAPRGEVSTAHGLEDAGFDRQPPAREFAFHVEASLAAADGQTLGYPWVGIVDNWHEPAFTSFGDGHGVWETGGGPALPFYSRNFTTVLQRLSRLSPDELMPRALELREANDRAMPPAAPVTRRLNVTPDRIQSHGVDLAPLLSAQGTGLVWAAVAPGDAIPESEAARRASSTIVQVTNLGISV